MGVVHKPAGDAGKAYQTARKSASTSAQSHCKLSVLTVISVMTID